MGEAVSIEVFPSAQFTGVVSVSGRPECSREPSWLVTTPVTEILLRTRYGIERRIKLHRTKSEIDYWSQENVYTLYMLVDLIAEFIPSPGGLVLHKTNMQDTLPFDNSY